MTGPQGMGPMIPGGGVPGFPGGGAPIGVTINQHSTQTDPAFNLPVQFTVVFDQPVTGFGPTDVIISGSAGFIDCDVSGTGTTYIVSVPKGPTVTINKGASQADPATSGPIVFDVVFSEAVSGFTLSDVTISGTANPNSVVVSGSGATYTVSVSGMSGAGTVIASIPGSVCIATATNMPNAASTSTDNIVDFAPAYSADGGTITNDGTYWYHTFVTSANLTVFTAIPSAERLIIGGGGGGGGSTCGGGGGAGECFIDSLSLSVNTYPIVIGAGGAGGASTPTAGSNGGNTTFNGVTARGGGGGGLGTGGAGLAGGQGGGGGYMSGGGTGFQYNGGNAASGQKGGGGGGAGGAGGNGSTSISGAGGIGRTFGAIAYGGGGSGGARTDDPNANVGAVVAGGGAGGSGAVGGNATAGRGAGGGGGAYNGSSHIGGGSGSTGAVVIRYPM